MLIPSCFHYYSSIIELDIRDGDASRSSFIVQDCFGYTGVGFFFLIFHIGLVIFLSRSVKIVFGFYGESINCFW